MHVSPDHVKTLLAIIAKSGLREKLGIHLLHRHESIPEGQIKLETKLQTLPGKWVKPVSIESLDLSAIHPVVFTIVSDFIAGALCFRLDPYEFGEGPSPVSVNDLVDNNCIEEFVNYITKHGLVDVIALEVLDSGDGKQPDEPTAEIEVGEYGTIILPKSMINGGELIPTGWPNIIQPYDPDGEPPAGQHWNKATSSTGAVTHKVHVDQIENEKGLLDELVRKEIIRIGGTTR
jgi:hypothetical protein